MQRGRSFLILLVVAAALGAWYYFVEAGRDPLAGEARARVFDVEPGQIDEVEVRADSGDVTRARRTDGEWRIVEPAEIEADVAAIGSLVSTLESLEVQHTVDENPASVGPYGLDPPRFSLAFRAGDASEMRRLEVGTRTPTGGDLYARVEGQPALLLIAGYLEDSLNKTTFALRDKSVLRLSRDVDRLRLDAPGRPAVEAAREDNDWRLTAPIDARADFSAVDGLISRILQGEMQDIASEEAGDLAEYGLDGPRATATLGSGSDEATLEIGASLDDTTVYARDTSRALVFMLDAALLEALTPDPSDLRMQDLFLFRPFNASGLTVTMDDGAVTYSKAAPAPVEGETAPPTPVWTRTAAEAGDVDQATMSGALASLARLRAESFVDRPVTSGDEVVVTVRFGSDAAPSEETVTFRKSGDTVHAIVAGEPGAAVVPTTDFDAAVAVIRQLAEGQ